MGIYWFAQIYPLHEYFLGVTNDGHFYSSYIRQHYLSNSVQHVNDFFPDSFIHIWFILIGKISSLFSLENPKNWTLLSAVLSYCLGIITCYYITNFFFTRSTSIIFTTLMTLSLMHYNTFGHRFHEVFAIYIFSAVFVGFISGKFSSLNFKSGLLCAFFSVIAFLSYNPIVILWTISFLIGMIVLFLYDRKVAINYFIICLNKYFCIGLLIFLGPYLVFILFNIILYGNLAFHPQYITKFDLSPNLSKMYLILAVFILYGSLSFFAHLRYEKIIYPFVFFLGGFIFYLFLSFGTSISDDNNFFFNSNLTKFIWGMEVAFPILIISTGIASYFKKYYFEIFLISMLLIIHFNYQKDHKIMADLSNFSEGRYEATKNTANLLDREFGNKKFFSLTNSEAQFAGYSAKRAMPIPYIYFNGSYLSSMSNMGQRIDDIKHLVKDDNYSGFIDYIIDKEINFISLSKNDEGNYKIGGTVAQKKRDEAKWSNMVSQSIIIPDKWINNLIFERKLDLLNKTDSTLQIKYTDFTILDNDTRNSTIDTFSLNDKDTNTIKFDVYNVNESYFLATNDIDSDRRPIIFSSNPQCSYEKLNIKPFILNKQSKYTWLRDISKESLNKINECKGDLSIKYIIYDEKHNFSIMPIFDKTFVKVENGQNVTSGRIYRDLLHYYLGDIKLNSEFKVDDKIVIHFVPTINNQNCKFQFSDQLFKNQEKIILKKDLGRSLFNECSNSYVLRIGKETQPSEVKWLN